MPVIHVSGGPFANESESNALRAVKKQLADSPLEWHVFTNVLASVSVSAVPDEIDMIVVGPTGIRIVEIKHWQWRYLKEQEHLAQREAEKLNEKIKRIVSKIAPELRRKLGYVQGRFLLTAESSVTKGNRLQVAGSEFFTLAEVAGLIGISDNNTLTSGEVRSLATALRPASALPQADQFRRLGNYRDLKLVESTDDRFHRIYNCVSAQSGDKLILHLFDLTVRDTPSKLEVLAAREVTALRLLHERGRWVPQISDSYQAVPHYDGELRFYTLLDPCAPSVKERKRDGAWSREQRLEFALEACRGLTELHSSGEPSNSFVHRGISPETLLVRYDNRPLFTGFGLARVPGAVSISSLQQSHNRSEYTSPEAVLHGLAASDQRSDIYSLCASLKDLFESDDPVTVALSHGSVSDPGERSTLADLVIELEACRLRSAKRETELPVAQYWSEGLTLAFQDHKYRIVSMLGKGSFGATYKVVEVKGDDQDGATYVGKVAFNRDAAVQMTTAYRCARPIIGGDNLATLYQYAENWEPANLVALLKYIDGQPIDGWRGYIEAIAEDLGRSSQEIVGGWIKALLAGLRHLHAGGYVHADVSARNIIVKSEFSPVLTDYDLVTKAGDPLYSPGTVLYSAPESQMGRPALCSHDIFALAAVTFEVVFDRDPFMHAGVRDKARGLAWELIDRSRWGWIPAFFDRATAPGLDERFADADQALNWILQQGLTGQSASASLDASTGAVPLPAQLMGIGSLDASRIVSRFGEQEVHWLEDLLATYPASTRGNLETRGLDSPFARQTYVPTILDAQILDDVRTRRAQLVILCGNAGDGKTAFLQNLARNLGLPVQSSAERVWEGDVSDGLHVIFNLDGAASYAGKSADMLLDELLEPFGDGSRPKDRVHFLAINNGRLLEWIESREKPTPLADFLHDVVLSEAPEPNPGFDHVRFVDLNQRSLVGNVEEDSGRISTEFIESLLDHLIGGEHVAETWAPCNICTASSRCTANLSMRLLSRKRDPRRNRVLSQLTMAFQAVHQRGQVHITTRELRAALTYVFFGVHYCSDLHENQALTLQHYWDRAFDVGQESRQGNLLDELAKLDPALDSNPMIDRYVVGHWADARAVQPPQYEDISLASARRRAYFEWLPNEILEVAGNADALPLFQGEHIREFASVRTNDPEIARGLCRKLCAGIARLESLPHAVLGRLDLGIVPLKIMPRTPIESVFWVEKPLSRFTLYARRPVSAQYVDWLHNELTLVYRYVSGRVESLSLNSVLFSLLLDLADGYHLMGDAARDVFANLTIFTQRLAEEAEDELYAWEPTLGGSLYRVRIEHGSGIQNLTLAPVERLMPGS